MENGNCIFSSAALFGSEDGGSKHGNLTDYSEAYIYQSSSSEHIFGGAVEGKGGGKQTKPDNIGWAYLSDGMRGLGAGVKWFWQLHPKSIEFNRDGIVYIGLYPEVTVKH